MLTSIIYERIVSNVNTNNTNNTRIKTMNISKEQTIAQQISTTRAHPLVQYKMAQVRAIRVTECNNVAFDFGDGSVLVLPKPKGIK